MNGALRLSAPLRRDAMLTDLMMYAGAATVAYGWLCAIVAPMVTAARSCVRERCSRRAAAVLALAVAAAAVWTVVPPAVLLLGMMLEPRAGLALVAARGLGVGFASGIAAWLLHLALERRMPRIGVTFETATAVAIGAAIKDDDRTLAKVEGLYRSLTAVGSSQLAAGSPVGSCGVGSPVGSCGVGSLVDSRSRR